MLDSCGGPSYASETSLQSDFPANIFADASGYALRITEKGCSSVILKRISVMLTKFATSHQLSLSIDEKSCGIG